MKTKNLLPKTISILFFAIMLLSTKLLSAQDDGQTSITLKSGEKITGKVIEAVPEQYIKIELKDGTVKKILSADISSMQTEQSSNKDKKKVKVVPSAIGGVGVSYDLSSKQGYVMIEPKIIGGFKAGLFRMGGGVSFIYARRTMKSEDPFAILNGESPHRESLELLPVFANFHFDFGKKKVKPSLDISGGYPINLSKAIVRNDYQRTENPGTDYDGIPYTDIYQYDRIITDKNKGLGYMNAGVGVTYEISKKLSINGAVQYQLVAYSSERTITGEYLYSYWNEAGKYYNTYTGPYDPDTVAQKRILHSIGLSISVIY
jgi:hypothetical protein